MRARVMLAVALAASPLLAEEGVRLKTDPAFLASAKVYNECFDRWLDSLASVNDPVDVVAGTVLAECRKELGSYAREMHRSVPLLSFGEVYSKVLEGQKTVAMQELVKRHAAQKSVECAKDPEPKTREGKIASCDVKAAQFRQWAAEHGPGIRVAALEEQVEEDEGCRKAAEALPSVEGWLKTHPNDRR